MAPPFLKTPAHLELCLLQLPLDCWIKGCVTPHALVCISPKAMHLQQLQHVPFDCINILTAETTSSKNPVKSAAALLLCAAVGGACWVTKCSRLLGAARAVHVACCQAAGGGCKIVTLHEHMRAHLFRVRNNTPAP